MGDGMVYRLSGTVLELCSCGSGCGCDRSEYRSAVTCQGAVAWQIENGTVEDTDVSGRTVALVTRIDEGTATGVLYVDEDASPEERTSLERLWTGRLGGPVADLVQLIGPVEASDQEAVSLSVHGRTGRFRIGASARSKLSAVGTSAGGNEQEHENRAYSGMNGSPACVGLVSSFRTTATLDFEVDLDADASRASFRFVSKS